MRHVIEHFAVSVSAITAVLAARGKQVDLFGVIVLALVAALGGGTIRDLLLARGPVFWTVDSGFLINASITAVVTFYLVRFHELPEAVLLVADAFSLALFTILGTQKAMGFEVAPSIAVVMGVTTGVAGGISRDLLLGQIPLVFQAGTYFYATAAFLGASVFVLLHHWPVSAEWNLILGIMTVLVMRLAGIRWRIALPALRPKEPKDKNQK